MDDGWHRDPFGRYEERYFYRGRFIELVRSHGKEQRDQPGFRKSAEGCEVPPTELAHPRPAPCSRPAPTESTSSSESAVDGRGDAVVKLLRNGPRFEMIVRV